MARSFSDCTTLVDDTHNSQSSPSRPIEGRPASAKNPSNTRPGFSTPSHSLFNLQNAAANQYAKEKKTSASMRRVLSEKDRTSNLFTTTDHRIIRGYDMQSSDADEHVKDEIILSPASPIRLDRNSQLIRHLDNGTWQVGLRSPNVLGRDVRRGFSSERS